MSDNKILTVVIPSYNSQEYLERAVKTTLINADDIEVIIVDDGSTDNTPQLADDLAKKYQNIVRVIHKENGGHGDAVMTGLKNAKGMYFKVLDSDDWFNTKALNAILVFLRANSKVGEQFDMVISEFGIAKRRSRGAWKLIPLLLFSCWLVVSYGSVDSCVLYFTKVPFGPIRCSIMVLPSSIFQRRISSRRVPSRANSNLRSVRMASRNVFPVEVTLLNPTR